MLGLSVCLCMFVLVSVGLAPSSNEKCIGYILRVTGCGLITVTIQCHLDSRLLWIVTVIRSQPVTLNIYAFLILPDVKRRVVASAKCIKIIALSRNTILICQHWQLKSVINVCCAIFDWKGKIDGNLDLQLDLAFCKLWIRHRDKMVSKATFTHSRALISFCAPQCFCVYSAISVLYFVYILYIF